MAQHLWIIDPDPTSAQAMRSALDLLGPEVDTFEQIPQQTELPHAVLIAGAVGSEQLEDFLVAVQQGLLFYGLQDARLA